jgi:hypothetical protein
MAKNSSQRPFIEIEVITTLETELTSKNLLDIIKQRFEKTHKVKASWIGSEVAPIIRLEYTYLEDLIEGYSRDLFLFNYFTEIFISNPEEIQDLLDAVKVRLKQTTSKTQADLSNDCLEPRNYVVLKYRTNFKDPLRKNYQFTARIAQMLGENVCIEEVQDGFLYFFQTKDAFEDANFDKLNPKELMMWFQKQGIDTDHPKIKDLFSIIKQKI